MNTSLGTWMKLAATAVVIAALIWNLLLDEMADIAKSVASLMSP